MSTYGLDEFIADMVAPTKQKFGQQELLDEGSDHLKHLLRNPACLPDAYKRPAGRGERSNHGNYVLHRGPGLFVSAVVWGLGDGVGPHDHRTWGMIGVFENCIQETPYSGPTTVNGGVAALASDRINLLKSGDVPLLTPDSDEIHSLDNFSDRPTVEIHVYSRDLVGLSRSRYDLSTGSIHSFASSKYDNC